MKLRPLKQIDALTEEQQQQVVDWVTTLTLAKTSELAREHFREDIPQTTLHRFRQRCATASCVAQDQDSAQARAELINAAAAGKPKFGEATVYLLEKYAFELAHAPQEPENIDALKDLFGLLNSSKNTTVRERLAAVQERKAALREKELELKQSNSALHRHGSPQEHAQMDHLGYLASNLDELEERATKQFNLPPLPPKTVAAPCESAANSDSDHDSRRRHEESREETPAVPVSDIRSGHDKDAQLPTNIVPLPNPAPAPEPSNSIASDLGHSNESRPYRQAEKNPDPAPAPRQSAQDSTSDFDPRTSHLPSAAPLPPLSPVQHPSTSAPAANSPSALSPEPSSLPQPYRQSEKNLDPAPAPRQSAPPSPPSASSELSAVSPPISLISENSCSLVVSDLVESHAIKRWRSFIPREKDAPEPDNSWQDECACGKPLPCPDHPDLWLSIRYYRPQNVTYKETLEDAGIPYYIPTAAELGCSEEVLKKIIDPFTNNPQIKDAPSPYGDPFQGKLKQWVG